jgi:hypothetical protein
MFREGENDTSDYLKEREKDRGQEIGSLEMGIEEFSVTAASLKVFALNSIWPR